MKKVDGFGLDSVGHHIAIHLCGCAFIAILHEENDLLLMNIMGSNKDVKVDGVDMI